MGAVSGSPRVTSGRSWLRESRLPGSVRAKPNGRATRPRPIRTVPLSTDDAAARCRSSERAASSNCSATGNKAAPASLSRSPSGSRSNSVGPPKTASNAAIRRPTVGWLMPRARPAARKEPCRATARKMRASFQSSSPEPLVRPCMMIHPRIGTSRKQAISDFHMYHYVGWAATCFWRQ